MCAQIEQLEAGSPGRLKVTAKSTETDEIIEGEYNTVSVIPSSFLYNFAVYETVQLFIGLVFCIRF